MDKRDLFPFCKSAASLCGVGLALVSTVLAAPLTDTSCLRLNGTCVDLCPMDYVLLDRKCLSQCPEGFVVADDNTTCVDSNCPFSTENGTCLSVCTANTYPNPNSTNGTTICLPCDSLCSECTGPGIEHCLNCTHFQLNGTCVTECPNGTFTFGVECVKKCPSSTVRLAEGRQCLNRCPPSLPYLANSTCQGYCPNFVHHGECVYACPNGTYYTTGNQECFAVCPERYPYILGDRCLSECPRQIKYSLDNLCIDACPASKQFVPGNDACLSRCPRRLPYVFNQVCMKNCPPGTYRTLDDTGFRCLPYVGLRGIAAVVTCFLVLLCVIFGICMSKQYNLVKKTEESIAVLASESKKAVMNDESGRYRRSATIGLIHVNSERRSSAEQPLLPSSGL